jgi:hypothetical protein
VHGEWNVQAAPKVASEEVAIPAAEPELDTPQLTCVSGPAEITRGVLPAVDVERPVYFRADLRDDPVAPKLELVKPRAKLLILQFD